MSRGTRAVLGIIVGWIVQRILAEFMDPWSALLVGVMTGVAIWLATKKSPG